MHPGWHTWRMKNQRKTWFQWILLLRTMLAILTIWISKVVMQSWSNRIWQWPIGTPKTFQILSYSILKLFFRACLGRQQSRKNDLWIVQGMLDKEYFITLGSVRKVHSSVFYPPPKDCKSGKDGPECMRNIVLLRFDAIPNVKPIDIPAAQMNIDGTNKSKFSFLHFLQPFLSLKNLQTLETSFTM